jgi:hypothetical protein
VFEEFERKEGVSLLFDMRGLSDIHGYSNPDLDRGYEITKYWIGFISACTFYVRYSTDAFNKTVKQSLLTQQEQQEQQGHEDQHDDDEKAC